MGKKTVLVMTACSLFNAFAANNAATNELANAQTAIVLINHIGWELDRIKGISDAAMLEAEYEMISLNQLNLSAIKDKETINQIRTLCDYITSKRIADGEQKMLQRELDYNLDNALYGAFPSPSAILVADWRLIAYNLVQSAVSGYMNYKKAVAGLKIGHERKLWEIKKNDIEELNDAHNKLMEDQWKLIQQYGLDDYWRVSQGQSHELVARVENVISKENNKDLFGYLNHPVQRKTFQKLPVFWYYLGVAAEKEGHADVALEAYDRYQSEFCQILRFDRIASSVAMNKALILLKEQAAAELIRKQLKIIECNMSGDWTFMYFCASVYFDQLKDAEAARRTLDQAINILRYKFDDTLTKTTSQCERNELSVSDHTIPNAMPLIACLSLRLRMEGDSVDVNTVQKMMCEAQRTWGKNCFGMLSFYGRLPFSEIQKYLLPGIRGIHLEYQHDDGWWNNPTPYRFILTMPLDWFYAGPFDVALNISFNDGIEPKSVSVGLHPRYSDTNPAIMADGNVRYVLDCPSDIVRRRSPLSAELNLKHKFYPLAVNFNAEPLKNIKSTHEKNVVLEKIEACYKNKKMQLK